MPSEAAVDTHSETSIHGIWACLSALIRPNDNSGMPDRRDAFYGSSWMQSMLETRRIADSQFGSSRDELGDYLGSPLQRVAPDDVIRWWGVSYFG
jgi:hypothetical protein